MSRSPSRQARYGRVRLDLGILERFGNGGFTWSSIAVNYSASTSATSHYLDFNPGTVNPSFGPRNRYFGFPVRCLVYKLEKRKTPYFVRSGRISPRSVMWPGNESDFWSRTASNYGTSTNAGAHNFYANYGSTNSSLGNYRYVGFPVRCLVILVLVCVGELEPLYFVRSGDLRLDLGVLWRMGLRGVLWANTASSYILPTYVTTYHIDISASGILTSGGPTARHEGLPVRCLVILVCCVSVPTCEVMTARRAEPGQNHDPSFSEGFDFERLTRTEKVGTETH